MTNKILIFLLPKKLLIKDLLSYEFNKYKEQLNCKIEIHEILDFLYPNLVKSFQNEIDHDDLIKFKYLEDWKKHILKLKSKYGDGNIFIFNLTLVDGLKSFQISYFIKSNGFKSINFSLKNVPIMPSNHLNIIDYYFSLIKFISSIKKISILVNYKFFSFLNKLLKLSPEFHLSFGSDTDNKLLENKNIKILNGNSEDYNLHLNTANQKTQTNIVGDYAIYLESPTPFYEGDAPIMGISKYERGTPENWFNSLDKFFSYLEKKLNLNVLIAPHPKLKHPNDQPEQYKGRKITNDLLSVVSRKAKIIINRDSTGVSFAVVNKVPLVFIFTSELLKKKNTFLKRQKYFANQLGLQPLNINDNFNDLKIDELLIINNEKYDTYKKRYLTSRRDQVKNFDLIKEIILK